MKPSFIKLIYTSGCFSLFWAFAIAQIGVPFITNYLPKEFGAGAQSWCITQDNRGIIYIGNSIGILEYDGVNWRTIQLPKGTVVRSIDCDSNGRIYTGGQNDFGFLRPDSLGQLEFVTLTNKISGNMGSFNDVWYTVCTNNGIYFQTSKAIFRYINDEIQNILPKTSFHTMMYDGNGLYVRQREVGLMEIIEDSLIMVKNGSFFRDTTLFTILPYSNKSSIYGSMFDGFFIKSNNLFHEKNTKIGQYIFANELYTGCKFPNNRFAFATLQGGVVITDSEISNYKIVNNNSGIIGNGVVNLGYDNQQNLWLTLSQGISKVDVNFPFTLINKKNGLNNLVFDITIQDSFIYLTTSNGILYLSSNTNNSSITSHPIKIKDIPGIIGNTMKFFSINNLNGKKEYFVANIFGLYSINNGHATKLISAENDNPFVSILVSNYEPNKIYIGTEQGLISVEKSTNQFSNPTIITKTNSLVYSITEDSQSNLWLSTQHAGVYFLKRSEDKKSFSNIAILDTSNGLPAGHSYIYKVDNQIVVSAGGGGVYKPVYDNKLLFRFVLDTLFFKKSGINDLHSAVSPIIQDKNGNVWMSVDNQIRVIKPVFDSISGLITHQIDTTPFKRLPPTSTYCIYPEDNGVTWFGGPDGVIRYDSNIDYDYEVDFPALIRKVTLEDDSVIFWGTYSDKNGVSSTIQPEFLKSTIPYNLNQITFEYAGPSFDDEKANQFKYYLEGFDKTWSKWSTEPKKNYTNIPEGKYKFRVIAKNIYDHKSQEAIYEFTVLPPWYRTAFAYLGYMVLFIGSFYGFNRWNTRQLKEKNIRLEKIIGDRTKEIQDKNVQLEGAFKSIATKNKDITDSIKYAKRIQLAIMEEKEEIYKALPNCFIFYKPRDIVSGDFYYFADIPHPPAPSPKKRGGDAPSAPAGHLPLNNGRSSSAILAVVDCTGHGVPGAFMSMIGNDQLNKIIQDKGFTKPSVILDRLHINVRNALHQHKEQTVVRDGMDIALCNINLAEKKVEYAGAHNSLYICRNGEKNHEDIEIIKADRLGIGGEQMEEGRKFTNNTIELNQGDTTYMFSDGFPDQFGGPKNKKFGPRRFRELLLNIQEKAMKEQEGILDDAIVKWMGNYEQTDDILVIGVRV